MAITDTGAGATVTTLATAGVNQMYRGVAIAPDAGLAPQFFNAVPGTNGFVLSWTSLLNRNYTVQYNTGLGTTNWLMLTNLNAIAPVTTVVDSAAPNSTNRFYRVLLNP